MIAGNATQVNPDPFARGAQHRNRTLMETIRV
jgi:hypothetical protein